MATKDSAKLEGFEHLNDLGDASGKQVRVAVAASTRSDAGTAEPKKLTYKAVNKALKVCRGWAGEELAKGDGYLYFTGGNASKWQNGSSVFVAALSHVKLITILESFDAFVEEHEAHTGGGQQPTISTPLDLSRIDPEQIIENLASAAVLSELSYYMHEIDRDPEDWPDGYTLVDALDDLITRCEGNDWRDCPHGMKTNLRTIEIALGRYVEVSNVELAHTVSTGKKYAFSHNGKKYKAA